MIFYMIFFGNLKGSPSTSNSSFEPRVIYGVDNRLDIYEVLDDPVMVQIARSTAAVVYTSDIGDYITTEGNYPEIENPEEFKLLPSATFGQMHDLCTEEPFFEQPSAAFCSGFLVGYDVIATAGHCIESIMECSDTAFIFDYALFSPDDDATVVKKDNIYYCKEIIARKLDGIGADYGIIRLDRHVEDRKPLTIRRGESIQIGEKVTIIGHPSGLPTKISGDANVIANEDEEEHKDFFLATTDSYGGNSGSAIINNLTGVVEGILVRGEQDFKWSEEGCMISNVCTEDSDCTGEEITRSTTFASFVQPLVPTVSAFNWNFTEIEGNMDGLIQPGETLSLKFTAINSGLQTASNIKLSLLSNTPGITILGEDLTLDSLDSGQKLDFDSYSIQLASDIECGSTIEIKLNATWSEGHLVSATSFKIGKPVPIIKEIAPEIDITDNSKKGIVSELEIPFVPNGSPVLVPINISHTYIGDLEISITPPNGNEITLWKRSGGSTHDLIGTLGDDLVPYQNMDTLKQVATPGIWRLKVSDQASSDEGTLKSWGVKTFKYICSDE